MTDAPGWQAGQPTERATGRNGRRESSAANRALRDYLALGPTRSLAALLDRYAGQPGAPTHSAGTLRNWAGMFFWADRAQYFDSIQAAQQRQSARSTGAALAHERVETLKTLLAQVEQFLQMAQRLARIGDQDLNQAGAAERMALVLRSSAPLFGQARGMLADLARETGGRGRPEEQPESTPPDLSQLSDAELEALAEIMKKVEPRQLSMF
jgi:hypothetical protein